MIDGKIKAGVPHCIKVFHPPLINNSGNIQVGVPPSNIIEAVHILDGRVLSFNYSFDEIKIKQRSNMHINWKKLKER